MFGGGVFFGHGVVSESAHWITRWSCLSVLRQFIKFQYLLSCYLV